MNVTTTAYMKRVASKNLNLKDLIFKGFESVEISDRGEKDPEDLYIDDIEVLANFSLKYDGTVPDSYRVLNGIVQDWVDGNEEEIRKALNPKLITFLKEQYKEIDLSEIEEDIDDFIWDEQVDYFPEVNERDKDISFTLELVLEVEETE